MDKLCELIFFTTFTFGIYLHNLNYTILFLFDLNFYFPLFTLVFESFELQMFIIVIWLYMH